MFKHLYLLIIAFIFGTMYIFYTPSLHSELFGITIKIIPMISFILYAALTTKFEKDLYKKWILIGLSFCMVGDATLRWFIFGLTSFLIGHICYIIAFLQIRKKATPKIIILLLLFYGIIISAWVVGNITKSGNFILAFAVICYIGVILTMAWSAFQTKQPFVIFGAILFLISDSILSLNMFVTTIHYSTFFIMTTYYSAQLLFAFSVPKHFAIRKEMLE